MGNLNLVLEGIGNWFARRSDIGLSQASLSPPERIPELRETLIGKRHLVL